MTTGPDSEGNGLIPSIERSYGLTKRILDNLGVPFVFGGFVYAVVRYLVVWSDAASITVAALVFVVVFGFSFAYSERRAANSFRVENQNIKTELGNLKANVAGKESDLKLKEEMISQRDANLRDANDTIRAKTQEVNSLRKSISDLESQLQAARSRVSEFQKRESDLLSRIGSLESERDRVRIDYESGEKTLTAKITSLERAGKSPLPRFSIRSERTGLLNLGPAIWFLVLENAGEGLMKDIEINVHLVVGQVPQNPLSPAARGTPLLYSYGGLRQDETFEGRLPISGNPATGTTIVGTVLFSDLYDRRYAKPVNLVVA